jgi:hypothetical protein
MIMSGDGNKIRNLAIMIKNYLKELRKTITQASQHPSEWKTIIVVLSH